MSTQPPSYKEPAYLDPTGATHIPVPKAILTPAKIVWIGIAGVCIILFFIGLTVRFSILLNATPEEIISMNQLPISITFRAWWLVGVELILMLGFSIIGISIFLQKSNDLAAFVTSLMLVTFGTTILNAMNSLVLSFQGFEGVVRLAKAINWVMLLPLFFIFPDGRFFPKWTRWAALIWALWHLSWLIFPNLPYNPTLHGALADPVAFILYLTWFSLGIYSQVARYRTSASQSEKQQTKWIVFGFIISVVGTFIEELPSVLDPSLLEINPAGILYNLISTTFFVSAVLVIPITIALSIHKTRLWQIDYVINKSLVYGTVSLLLGAIFITGLVLIQNIFAAFTGGSQSNVAFAISTLIIAGLFRPTKNWLQSVIDQRFYGIQIQFTQRDAQKFPSEYSITEKNYLIGDFLIQEPIGKGGMAEVYKANHKDTGDVVALKLLPPQLAKKENFIIRFEREAQAVSKLKHPNIVEIYSYGTTKEINYMAMEYIQGSTLEKYIKDIKLIAIEDVIEIVTDIAKGLDYAHQNGIVHRDIKPSNIIIHNLNSNSSNKFRPVITDFGIAKMATEGPRLTQTGILGSFNYISPEQIQAAKDVDGATDIYSLGIITYQMVTGELPFPQNNPGAILISHLQQPPPNPKSIRPDLTSNFSQALLKALEKDPANRHSSASDFATALIGT